MVYEMFVIEERWISPQKPSCHDHNGPFNYRYVLDSGLCGTKHSESSDIKRVLEYVTNNTENMFIWFLKISVNPTFGLGFDLKFLK